MTLTSSGLKKLIKLILRANYKIQKVDRVKIENNHNLENEILRMKEKLKKRAELNKKLNEKKKKEFFEKKQAETIVEKNLHEKVKKNSIKKVDNVSDELDDDIVNIKNSPKPNLSKDKENEIISKINSVKSKFKGSDIDEKKIKLANDKKKQLNDIKIVLKDLEDRHNELEGHDPVTLLKLEEKINLLKKRISKMEHE